MTSPTYSKRLADTAPRKPRITALLLVAVLSSTFGSALGQARDPQPHPRLAASDAKDDAEADAAALLEEAHEELELGERRSAVRRLEILIHRYPRTRSAVEARDLIGQLREPPSSSEQPDARRETAPARPTEVRHLESQFQAVAGDRVFFAAASDEIGSRARIVLEQQVEWLRRHPSVRIVVEGHADDGGTDTFNADLAKRRAGEVRARLMAGGIADERIAVTALGRQQRIATCDAPNCAAQNRRVIIRFADDPHATRWSGRAGRILDRR